MTYAERVFEYSDLPTEPPAALPSDPPPGSWPRCVAQHLALLNAPAPTDTQETPQTQRGAHRVPRRGHALPRGAAARAGRRGLRDPQPRLGGHLWPHGQRQVHDDAGALQDGGGLRGADLDRRPGHQPARAAHAPPRALHHPAGPGHVHRLPLGQPRSVPREGGAGGVGGARDGAARRVGAGGSGWADAARLRGRWQHERRAASAGKWRTIISADPPTGRQTACVW
jgi:hypothetical protein